MCYMYIITTSKDCYFHWIRKFLNFSCLLFCEGRITRKDWECMGKRTELKNSCIFWWSCERYRPVRFMAEKWWVWRVEWKGICTVPCLSSHFKLHSTSDVRGWQLETRAVCRVTYKFLKGKQHGWRCAYFNTPTKTWVAGEFYDNLTKTRVIWEDGLSIEKMSP